MDMKEIPYFRRCFAAHASARVLRFGIRARSTLVDVEIDWSRSSSPGTATHTIIFQHSTLQIATGSA
jgi:hypothetical protein